MAAVHVRQDSLVEHKEIQGEAGSAPSRASRHMRAATGDSVQCMLPRPPPPRMSLSFRYVGGRPPNAAVSAWVWPAMVAGKLPGRCVGDPVAVDSTSQLASLCMRRSP